MIRHDASSKAVGARDRYDPAKRAASPSRQARCTGYRSDGDRHVIARDLVPAWRRREIASAGGQARAAMYGHTGDDFGALNPTRPRKASGEAAPRGATATPARAPAPHLTPAQVKAAAAARAAASRPARRAAQRARDAAKKGKR